MSDDPAHREITHITPLVAAESDYKFNWRLFKRIWRLAKPYWVRKAAWPSWLAMIVLLAYLAVSTVFNVQLAAALRDLTDALVGRNESAYSTALFQFGVFSAAVALGPIAMSVPDTWLGAHWRQWLTTRLVDQYLEERTYFDIALFDDLDNPDQRIQETVKPFVNSITTFPRSYLMQVVNVVSGVSILSTVSTNLIFVSFAIGTVQVIITLLVVLPTIKMNFVSTVAEADLRYGLLHVRENAEAVAFFHGEVAERDHILKRLATAIKRYLQLTYYVSIVSNGISTFFQVLWAVLPYLLLVPSYLAGEITFGQIAQGAAGSVFIINAIQGMSVVLPSVAGVAPYAIRLAQITERLDALKAGRTVDDGRSVRWETTEDSVELQGVTIETPRGEQELVRDLTMRLGTASSLMIVGPTGVGKSSVLRTMAGLWRRGKGGLFLPSHEHCMFLPQRPYMILGDLREQLLYPHYPEVDDEALQAILERVQLPDLTHKYGGLSVTRDWTRTLSLGEQQRIAFARILVSKPRFVFLDEATSAVDIKTENSLYRMLRAIGCSFISVGHRPSLLDHHTNVLSLAPGGGWRMQLVDDFREEEVRKGTEGQAV